MSAIRYDRDRKLLLIGDVEINDSDVKREAARWTTGKRGELASIDELAAADLAPFVREAVIVGARVLAIAASTADTVAVQQAVRSASEQVSDATKRATEASEDAVRRATESLTSATRQVHQDLSEQVERLVGGDNPELLGRLQPVLAGVGATLEKQVAEAVTAANRLVAEESQRRHDQLTDLIRAVQQDVAVKTAATQIRNVTTIKGLDYESCVHDGFEQVAAQMGDEYQRTGEFAGRLSRNKKGDGVLVIDGGTARIVIEAHDGSSKEWGSYLAEAEQNRGASAAIGVVRHVDDNCGRALRVVAQKRVVVAYDPDHDDTELLHTAALLMRAVALTTSGRFGPDGIATANEHIQEALTALEGLEDAKKSARHIISNAETIERLVNKAVSSANRSLGRAVDELTGVETAGPALVYSSDDDETA